MNRIKIAVLGYGRSGSTLHADPIDSLDEFEMRAVCDIDEKARTMASDRFSCATYSDYHDMISKEDLDLVVVVTRSDQHADMVCDCLERGHNVLVTKPWARNEAEARRMIGVAQKTGKLLLPWLPARWGSDYLKLRELIASGVIGRVFQIKRREYGFGIRYDWQTEEKYAGGLLRNWGPHMIDPPLLLAGGRVASVFGKLRQILNPGDVEDVFFSHITMDNGVTVISEHTLMDRETFPNWIIQGDQGTITVHETKVVIRKMTLGSQDTSAYRNKFEREISQVEADGPNRITTGNRYGDAKVIYPEIAQAVRGEIPYPVTTEDALDLTRVLDAVKLSSEENRVIHF